MQNDAELIELMKSNNRNAFADLYNRYKTSIYRYCLRMLADVSAAEDAIHETFFKMFSSVGTIQNPQALQSWLLKTARNEVMMYFRRKIVCLLFNIIFLKKLIPLNYLFF